MGNGLVPVALLLQLLALLPAVHGVVILGEHPVKVMVRRDLLEVFLGVVGTTRALHSVH